MAHIIRPISTQWSAAGWVPVGAPTLWEAVDEVTPDDTDYAQVTNNVQVWDLRFSPGTDHGIHTGHILRWRMKRFAVAIRMSIDLRQDDLHLTHLGVHLFLGPPNIFYLHTDPLTVGQAAMITNYATLGLRLQSNNFGVGNVGVVSWVELELPGALWTAPIVQTDPATEIT